jgi:orotate phosphoribosyltransferase
VAIVNDVINAGSAVRGTFRGLAECGANTVAIGSVVVPGSWALKFSEDHGVRLEALTSVPNRIWEPSACPLCAAGRPLDDAAATSASSVVE